MAYDQNKPWPLGAEKPTPSQLMDWTIRLDPTLAKRDPSMAIVSVLALYMRATEVTAKWEKIVLDFARDEMLREENQLLASLINKEDTLREWLEKNATEERDKFKSGRPLLSAIRELYERGVALDSYQMGAEECYRVDRLYIRGKGMAKDGSFSHCFLTEKEARHFLELRQLSRKTLELQRNYHAFLESKKPSKKIVSGKSVKTAKRVPVSARKPGNAAGK